MSQLGFAISKSSLFASTGSKASAMRQMRMRNVLAMALAGSIPAISQTNAATITTSASAPTGSSIQISQPDDSVMGPALSGYRDYTNNALGAGQVFTPTANFVMTGFVFQGGNNGGNDLSTFNISIGSLPNNQNYYGAAINPLVSETADGSAVAADVAANMLSNYDTVTLSNIVSLTAGQQYYWSVFTPNGYYGLAGTPTGPKTSQNSTSTEYPGGESVDFYANGRDSTPGATPTGIYDLQDADHTFYILGYVPVSTAPQWSFNGNGAWLTSSNWSTNTVPLALGDVATFGDDNSTITVSPVVTLAAPVTISEIDFSAPSGLPNGGYNIANGGAGLINCGPVINVTSGNHTINVPFHLIDNYANSSAGTFNILTGASLTIPTLTGGDYGNLTVSGGGSLTVNAFNHLNVTINGATVTTIAGSAPTGGGYDSFNGGAVLNINTFFNVIQLYDDGSDTINIGSGGTFATETQYGSGVFTNATFTGSGTLSIGGGTDLSNTGGFAQATGNNANFSGPIVVTNGFTFQVGSQYTAAADSMLGNATASNTITLNNGTLESVNGFTGTHAIIAGSGGGTFNTSDNVNGTVVVSNFTIGSISGPGTLNVIGGGTITVAPQVLPANSSGGIRSLALGGLNIAAGSVLLGSPASHANRSFLQVGSLTLAGSTGSWTTLLDLGTNDLDVQGGNYAQVVDQLKQGYSNGTWSGTGGIISSAAATDSRHLTALGVLQTSANGTFDGQSVSSGDVLVKYTFYGDADLSGRVDGSDYTRIDNGFLTRASGWQNGDFNYDGVVNGSDYALIDNAFNTQGASLAAAIAAPTAQIAGSGASSAVPEPASLGLIGIAAVGVLSRRNRRRG